MASRRFVICSTAVLPHRMTHDAFPPAVVFITSNYIGNSEMMQVRGYEFVFISLAYLMFSTSGLQGSWHTMLRYSLGFLILLSGSSLLPFRLLARPIRFPGVCTT